MIELRTLGTLDLRRGDGPELLSVLSQPKRAALLCYLALARPRGFHRRDTLLPLFWPEADAEHARSSLRQALHRLRESLGEAAIVSRGDEDVGLAAGVLWCDAVAFEEALDACEAERALALYGGELLPGLYVEGAPEFERWLEAERARLHDRAVRGAWSRAEAHEREGDAAGAGEWGRRALELAPADEALLRGYMELVARAGDPGRAEEAYRGYARRLREEYELEPTSEVSALAEQIRSRRGTPVASAGRAATPGAPGGGAGAAGESDRRHAAAAAPGTSTSVGPSPAQPSATTAPQASSPDGTGSPASESHGVRRLVIRWRWPAALGLVALAALGFGIRTWRARPSVVPLEQRSIAVLPLLDVSPGRDQAYFADGLTAELIALLGQIPGLRVSGATSSFFFKGRTQALPLKEIARRLGVAHVLEGTVLRQGDRVRVTVRLTNVATDRQLWTQSYQAANTDILALQREVARYIAGRFALKGSDIPVHPPSNPEAYDLYLQGQFAWRNAPVDPTTGAWQQARAIDLFRKAIALDPGFAPAWAGLAEAHYRALDFRQAKAEALRAIALDSTLALAHHALASTLAYGEWKWAEAEREFDRGIRLAPSNAHLYVARAGLRFVLGREREAFADHDRGESLEPLFSDFRRNRNILLWHAGRYGEMLGSDSASGAAGIEDFGPGPLVGAGRRGEALALAVAGGDDAVVTVLRGSRREVFALVARRADDCDAAALMWLYVLDQRNRAGGSGESRDSVAAANLHEAVTALNDRVFVCIERGVNAHNWAIAFNMRDRWCDSLRSQPRFQALMRRVGLPD